jgi:alpha-beta hydrolase superfamily lysophospholipase
MKTSIIVLGLSVTAVIVLAALKSSLALIPAVTLIASALLLYRRIRKNQELWYAQQKSRRQAEESSWSRWWTSAGFTSRKTRPPSKK